MLHWLFAIHSAGKEEKVIFHEERDVSSSHLPANAGPFELNK